ncbi:MAG: sirohydrochlorin chelatase [Actinobacteria bacterium]|nr:sirohydrochlorin chelatase [Actinomycetota bacterium]
MTRRDALLIAGHGSRDPAGVAECAELIAAVEEVRPGLPTALGFIELSPPPIHDAAAALAAAGATHITVVPLVLLGAGHAKTDVPAAITRQRSLHPDVAFRYATPLGVHPDLLTIVDDRLAAAVAPAERADTAVLVVGRGSSDPDANSDLAKVGRLLWEGRPWPLVETAFAGITAPTVEAGLDRCHRLGARRVAVVPYFLFTGVLIRRIGDQARRWAARHPDVTVVVAGHLGVDQRVVRLVVERHDEAHAGEAHATCDRCIHRVALPGFEHAVGAPQTMHVHPHDPATHVHRPPR